MMLEFFDRNATHYDSERKEWSGPVERLFYARDCSFGLIAFENLRRNPKHICQISDAENTYLTNEEARLQGIRIARTFEKLGIKQNDIIGIAGRNTTYLFAVVLGCFFSGSAYHAINPNYDKKTAKHLFDITKPKLIFCDGQDLEKLRYASSEFETKIFTLKHHLKGVPSVLDLLEPTGDEHLFKPAELAKGTNQNLAILCSSGSTGLPKAVTISHLHRIWELADFVTADDIQYMASTMDWLSAFMSLGISIVFGAARVISDKPNSPEYVLELVTKYKVTFTIQSPPSMAAIVKCPLSTPEKLQSIRYFFYGGSKSTATIVQAMQNLLRNGRIFCLYGFTELNKVFSRNSTVIEKPNSCGLMLPGMRARIVDENGRNYGPNEIGELYCNHGENWAGYYRNSKETRIMFDEEQRWFRSGDLAYFDDDNYLYIVERKKEMLKYHGIQFYPTQIEEIITQMPDVKEVCVFGIESELHGDEAGAAVVKVKGSFLIAEDLVEYVRQQIEADYMQLHAGCKLVETIPKTPNGKIDRKATKKLFLEN